MPVTIIDTLQRGGLGTAPFPVIKEDDSRLSYITVVDLASRDAIAEWKRLPFMRVHVIGEATDYRLGVDVTIGGQVWTEVVDGGPSSGTFQLLSEKNQPSGYVGLEATGKINPIYIDNIYTNNSYVVATLAARNALTTLTGDIVHVTDLSKVYVKLNNNPPTNIDADFAELLFPGAVLSVNGQIGTVSITIASLLAVPANAADLNSFINTSDAILALNSVSALHTAQIAALQADVAALQASTSGAGLLLNYDPAEAYTFNQTVKFQETSGRYNLYVANASIAAGELPGVDPDWLRIGDYYTIAESNALLAAKADLVGGLVPVNQTQPASLIMTYIVLNLAARNAITPQVAGMRVYVTGNSKAYIYSPGHSAADPEGFVEEVSAAGSGGHIIQSHGATLPPQLNLNFTSGLMAVNNASNLSTDARWGGPLLVDTYIEFLDGNSYFNVNPGDGGDPYFSTFITNGSQFSELFQGWDVMLFVVGNATIQMDTAFIDIAINPGTLNASVGQFSITIGSAVGTTGQGLISDGAGNVIWGPVGVVTPNWSESTFGLARIATQAEVTAGVVDVAGITPLKLNTWWDVVKTTVTIPIATQAEMVAGTDNTKQVTPANLESKRSVKIVPYSNPTSGAVTHDCQDKEEIKIVHQNIVTGNITITRTNFANLEYLAVVIPITGATISITFPSDVRMAYYNEVLSGFGWNQGSKTLTVNSFNAGDLHEISLERSGSIFILRYDGPIRA